jgi:hypothetical protein
MRGTNSLRTAWSHYRVCGLILRADISFPEIPLSSAQQSHGTLSLHRRAGGEIAGADWFYKSLLPNGKPQLLVGQSEDGLVMRFPNLADFVIPPSGNRISYLVRRNTPKSTIRHLFLDYVLPGYLSRDRVVLHASAIRLTKKSAIAFLGKSGSGKSTMAASFWREGFQVISDDCAVLEHGNGSPMCVPSYPGLRLWDDSAKAVLGPGQKRSVMAHYSNKSRFKHPKMEQEFDGRPVPLTRIYWLDPVLSARGREIRILPIEGPRGLVRLLESSFRLNFKEARPLADEFKRLARIADSNLLSGVRFPRDFRRIGELTKTILDDLGQ